jgi:hypothetical protein
LGTIASFPRPHAQTDCFANDERVKIGSEETNTPLRCYGPRAEEQIGDLPAYEHRARLIAGYQRTYAPKISIRLVLLDECGH